MLKILVCRITTRRQARVNIVIDSLLLQTTKLRHLFAMLRFCQIGCVHNSYDEYVNNLLVRFKKD